VGRFCNLGRKGKETALSPFCGAKVTNEKGGRKTGDRLLTCFDKEEEGPDLKPDLQKKKKEEGTKVLFSPVRNRGEKKRLFTFRRWEEKKKNEASYAGLPQEKKKEEGSSPRALFQVPVEKRSKASIVSLSQQLGRGRKGVRRFSWRRKEVIRTSCASCGKRPRERKKTFLAITLAGYS